MTTTAASRLFNPSIGRSLCLIRRWSCSILLFRYLLVRIRTRFGNLPLAFKSATARWEAARIEGDLGGYAVALHRPAQKGCGGIHMALPAQVELYRLATLVNGSIEVQPFAFHANISLIHAPGSAYARANRFNRFTNSGVYAVPTSES